MKILTLLTMAVLATAFCAACSTHHASGHAGAHVGGVGSASGSVSASR